ncbi:MAG: Flp family type IVb pilin [Acidibrevibacterium sp.]|jgi:pilus assembly protein Flp/PilA|uniref:Flp family type IVb pilin n=1 Tax=Acidibrevibacterium fodinaquatile TaxID=1969806 RepID=UPI0023A8B22F|nr:Flp family type IVb pilin [Acidibrevibacterium fodinaquatile]MCA7120449.1 Flp family type IVb pilin [Acidibrevibacterium fodinaquatile]
MISYLKTWLALKTDRRAVTALEYGLIAALIALGIVTAVKNLAGGLSGTFAAVTALLP